MTTTEQAKAAVKEYLDTLGEPLTTKGIYRPFYNALHDWANSPESNAELEAFRARVRAALIRYRYE